MNYSASIKIGDGYKTVFKLKDGKYGPQLSIHREVLVSLLKDTSQEWLNFNVKDWDQGSSKPEPVQDLAPNDQVAW